MHIGIWHTRTSQQNATTTNFGLAPKITTCNKHDDKWEHHDETQQQQTPY
jgi:hypothetical protein